MTSERAFTYQHPELPEGWTIGSGSEAIETALRGKDGPAAQAIAEVVVQMGALLLQKNSPEGYGNSALEPVRIFARGLSALDGIHVRMDDKLSRLARGGGASTDEDPVWDLAGYCVLELIARDAERSDK